MPPFAVTVKIPGMEMSHKCPARYPVPACTPANPHCTTQTVRRSKFLAQSCRMVDREMALTFLGTIRSKYPDATHNCWAFVAGPPGDTANIGCSDDGEPKGTAGRPMLNVLLHSGTGQICVVVTRWFGGIKLGTGGLVKAYQDAVVNNLETLPTIEAIPRETWRVTLDYANLEAARRAITLLGASIESQTFDSMATLLLAVPRDMVPKLANSIAEATNGTAHLLREPAR